jgi:hypothetical protein
LLALVERDLEACQTPNLSVDWRLNIAYNAALQAATAALAAAGYRAAREAHHLRVIQSLRFSIGAESGFVQQFDAFRKKRNLTSYEFGGRISDGEAEGISNRNLQGPVTLPTVSEVAETALTREAAGRASLVHASA